MATQALYEQYANQIYRYCVHHLGSREEAEDAVQSTFLNAFRGIKRGVVPEVESAWLFKIAHNVCLSRRRSSWRRGRVESPTDFEFVEELTPAPSRRADELIGLQDVLEEMPETQRRAILLREWQGLSYREIGEELQLSQAAVETLIFRARRALASGLEQPPRRRVARALDLGNLATAVKSLFVGGTTAAKVAATVAAVSATTVVAAPAVKHYVNHGPAHLPPPAKTQTVDAPAKSKPSAPLVASQVEAPARVGPAAAVRRPVAAASRRTVHRASTTRTHAAPTVAKHAPAVVSKAAATKHGKSAGAGHERSTEAAEVGGGAKETMQAKQEKQSTGRAGERSRRPDVSPAASSSPKGTVAVPDEPSGDETNAGGDQGGGLKKGRSEAAVALEDVASASAAAEPAALKRGNANAKDTGE